MLTFEFSGVRGVMTRHEPLTAGMVGRKVRLCFSQEWEELRKIAVFRAGDVVRDVVDVSEEILVPAQVLAKPLNRLYLGIYGTNEQGDQVIPTVWAEGPMIEEGTAPSGDPSTEPENPVWQQILGMIGDLRNLTTGERQNLVAAINEAANSGGSGNSGETLEPDEAVGAGAIKITDDGKGNVVIGENNAGGDSGIAIRSLTLNGTTYNSFPDLEARAAQGNPVEPQTEDIPSLFFTDALPDTADMKMIPFRYVSKTMDFRGYCQCDMLATNYGSYPKKNQILRFYRDAGCSQKLEVNFKGWGKQNTFELMANWTDITHSRNLASARLWADVVKSRDLYHTMPEQIRTSPNQGTVDGFPVKVYAAGTYLGRYTLNIPKAPWMANMDAAQENYSILCSCNFVSGCFRAEAVFNGNDWQDVVHATIPNAIQTRWNEAIRFVMNSTDEEFVAGIGNYFDLESLIDYYLFAVATCGVNAFGKNQLYMTVDGQKWYATMYDMGATWGLSNTGDTFLSESLLVAEYQDYVEGQGNLLYKRLESLFYETMVARWNILKMGPMSLENIIHHFEKLTDIASPELVKEDYAVTTGDGRFTEIPSATTNNIQQIRAYAQKRRKRMETVPTGDVEMAPGMLYMLKRTMVFDGETCIDTGVPLLESKKDFTIVAQFDCDKPASEFPGYLLGCGFAEDIDQTALLLGYVNENNYIKVITSGLGDHTYDDVANGTRQHTWSNVHILVLGYSKGMFSYAKYLKRNANYPSHIKPHSKSVCVLDGNTCLIGARLNSQGDGYQDYWKGTLYKLDIYNRMLSQSEAITLVQQLAKEGVS